MTCVLQSDLSDSESEAETPPVGMWVNDALSRRGIIDPSGVVGELTHFILTEMPAQPTAAQFDLFFVEVTRRFKRRRDVWPLVVRTCASLYYDLGSTQPGSVFSDKKHVRKGGKRKPAVNSIIYELSTILSALRMKLRVSRYEGGVSEDAAGAEVDDPLASAAFESEGADNIDATLGSIQAFDMFDIVKLAFKGQKVSILNAPMRCVTTGVRS